MRSSKSEGNLLGFAAHRLLPTASQRPELVGSPAGAGVGTDGTAQVPSPPWGVAQPPAPGARVQHGQEPGESLSSPLRPLFWLPHGLAVGAGCPGGGSVTPCDQRSLGTLYAALDIQTLEAEGGWGPRPASDLCLRVWASGHTLAWTRGQPAHPEEAPRHQGSQPGAPIPCLPFGGKPRAAALLVSTSPQGAPSRPWHRLFLCYRGMEGSFAILQTFPDVHVQPQACSGHLGGSRVPAVAQGW